MRIFICIFLLSGSRLLAQDVSPKQYREDFEYFWKSIDEDYCYFDKKKTDWKKVRSRYLPMMDTVSSRGSFVLLLEKVFNELYDHHASLGTNTRESQRLVPSGTDVWAEYINGKPIITEVRVGFGAYKSGLAAGMELVAFNDQPIETAIQPLMPQCLKQPDVEAKNYALRSLLAGTHSGTRKITARDAKGVRDFFPDQHGDMLRVHEYPSYIESQVYPGNVGYIRINNRLWDNGLIALFDSVLLSMKNTKALVLDLRETPSGGNTTVARAILGSFIQKEGFYQKHELTAEERMYGIKRSWLELVSPRKFVYGKPLVVLANHWTGSVGEGITIGFDALKRAKVIGTPLAGLNGAIYSYEMPNTKIRFSFPVEKLFHVNGSPREKFRPAVVVDVKAQKPGNDAVLKAALASLQK